MNESVFFPISQKRDPAKETQKSKVKKDQLNKSSTLKTIQFQCVKCDICLKNFSTPSNLQQHMSENHKPQKRVHRLIKSQKRVNAIRILLSRRWGRRYFSRNFKKILYQPNQLAREMNSTAHVNNSSIASDQSEKKAHSFLSLENKQHIQQNVLENDAVSNDCELEKSSLESLISTEPRHSSSSNLKRGHNSSNSNCSSDDNDETEETNQLQQSKKQKLVRVFNTNKYYPIELN